METNNFWLGLSNNILCLLLGFLLGIWTSRIQRIEVKKEEQNKEKEYYKHLKANHKDIIEFIIKGIISSDFSGFLFQIFGRIHKI